MSTITPQSVLITQLGASASDGGSQRKVSWADGTVSPPPSRLRLHRRARTLSDDAVAPATSDSSADNDGEDLESGWVDAASRIEFAEWMAESTSSSSDDDDVELEGEGDVELDDEDDNNDGGAPSAAAGLSAEEDDGEEGDYDDTELDDEEVDNDQLDDDQEDAGFRFEVDVLDEQDEQEVLEQGDDGQTNEASGLGAARGEPSVGAVKRQRDEGSHSTDGAPFTQRQRTTVYELEPVVACRLVLTTEDVVRERLRLVEAGDEAALAAALSTSAAAAVGVDEGNDISNPLQAACWRGSTAIVQMLLTRFGADPSLPRKQNAATPLCNISAACALTISLLDFSDARQRCCL